MMRPSAVRFLAVAAVLTAMLTVAGCGGDDDPESGQPTVDDTPAVCASVEALQKSFDDVKNVTLDRGALPALETSLTQMQADLKQVTSDAEDEYADEVNAIEQAASSVSSSLQEAGASPSAQTLSTVAIAVQSLGTSLTALQDAIKSTC